MSIPAVKVAMYGLSNEAEIGKIARTNLYSSW